MYLGPEFPFQTNQTVDVFVIAWDLKEEFRASGPINPKIDHLQASYGKNVLELRIVVTWDPPSLGRSPVCGLAAFYFDYTNTVPGQAVQACPLPRMSEALETGGLNALVRPGDITLARFGLELGA